MNDFRAMRRELLRTGGVGAATIVMPTASFAALGQDRSAAAVGASQVIFDVRKYGAI